MKKLNVNEVIPLSQKLNSKTNEGKELDDGADRIEFKVDDLPSRKEKHKRTPQTKKRSDKQKKKQRIRFPLVRIWLFLFLILVALVTTYPLWG
jgi:hypothetical protein